MVECKGCRRRVRADPRQLLAGIAVKWRANLEYPGSRLRCTACRHRGARIAPVPKIVSPLDCDGFRADIERMWEKLMAKELEGQCNAEISEPDGGGLVYVVSNSDKSLKMACLGTEREAEELLSQWLGARDYLECDNG